MKAQDGPQTSGHKNEEENENLHHVILGCPESSLFC